ncbi:hypothetical protein MJT46_016880 [Ovis ammon polii x Ovis aries]|nr:hypothetical protein MJT46_016880 [Ovis ammon polii x Ovis aries]
MPPGPLRLGGVPPPPLSGFSAGKETPNDIPRDKYLITTTIIMTVIVIMCTSSGQNLSLLLEGGSGEEKWRVLSSAPKSSGSGEEAKFRRLVRGELWSCFLPDAKICPARSTLHLSRSSTEKRPAGSGDQDQSFAAPQLLPAVRVQPVPQLSVAGGRGTPARFCPLAALSHPAAEAALERPVGAAVPMLVQAVGPGARQG